MWTRPASLTDPLPLTGLVGGDVDRGVAGRGGVFPGHPVDGLHLEAVAGVSLQVPHHHVPLPQPKPARGHVHVVIAARARAPVSQALLAHHVVDEVAPPARVLGLFPLQGQRGLVHAGYNVVRRRGDRCTHTHTHVGVKEGGRAEHKSTQLRL